MCYVERKRSTKPVNYQEIKRACRDREIAVKKERMDMMHQTIVNLNKHLEKHGLVDLTEDEIVEVIDILIDAQGERDVEIVETIQPVVNTVENFAQSPAIAREIIESNEKSDEEASARKSNVSKNHEVSSTITSNQQNGDKASTSRIQDSRTIAVSNGENTQKTITDQNANKKGDGESAVTSTKEDGIDSTQNSLEKNPSVVRNSINKTGTSTTKIGDSNLNKKSAEKSTVSITNATGSDVIENQHGCNVVYTVKPANLRFGKTQKKNIEPNQHAKGHPIETAEHEIGTIQFDTRNKENIPVDRSVSSKNVETIDDRNNGKEQSSNSGRNYSMLPQKGYYSNAEEIDFEFSLHHHFVLNVS